MRCARAKIFRAYFFKAQRRHEGWKVFRGGWGRERERFSATTTRFFVLRRGLSSVSKSYIFVPSTFFSLSLSLSLSRAWDGVWPICGRWNSRSSFLLIRPTLDRKTGASVPTRIKRLPRRGGFLTAPVRKTNPALGDSTRTRQTPPKDDTRSSCCCCDVGANDVFSRNRAVKNLDSKSARADVER